MVYCMWRITQKEGTSMKCLRGFRVLLGAALALSLVLPAGAEGNRDFVKEVNGLPKLETVKTLSAAEQQALYAHIDGLWEDGFYSLSKEDQKKLEATPQYTALAGLTEYLNNAQISQPVWLDSGALCISGEDLKDGEDYYYDVDAKELVITGTKPVTVAMAKDVETSTDTLRTKGEAQVTLVDVTVAAPEGKNALEADGGLKLTLVGSNTLTAVDQAAIYGHEGVILSGTGSLTLQGGTESNGIGTNRLTVTGGTVTVTGGDGAPGTKETAGGSGSDAVGANVITVTGGSLKLTGGKAGTDDGGGTGADGAATIGTAITDGEKPLYQTVIQLTDKDNKPVADTAVAALALSPDQTYGLQGVVTDETGSIYLYLPQQTKAEAVSDGTETYTGTPIVSGESGIMTLAQNGGSGDAENPGTTTTAAPTTETTAPTTTTTAPPTTETTAPPTTETTAPTQAPKAAQAAPRLEEPEAKTGNSVTLKAPTGGVGTVLYAYGLTDRKPDTNWVDTRIFLNLEPGKTYYFFAYYAGDDKTEPSPVSEALAVTLQSGFPANTIQVQGGEKTYDGKALSLSVTIPTGAAIRYREGTSGEYTQISLPNSTNAGTYTVGYQVTQEGYDTVTGTATIKINPAVPTITLADQSVKHDGNTHPMSGAKVTGVNGESFKGSVTYTYYTDGQCTQGETKTPPSAVGTYYVRASIAAGGNYTAAVSNTAKLTIEKSASTTTTKPAGNSSTSTTGFTVTASAGAGGSITQSGKVSVQSGKSASFTIVANKDYEVEDVKVDGKSIGSVGVYTFTNVKANHTIEATFRRTVAETTAPTTEPTTAPTEDTTVPTTEETIPETTQPEVEPAKKHKVPIIVPILLVVLAGGAIGGAVYIYKRYDRE